MIGSYRLKDVARGLLVGLGTVEKGELDEMGSRSNSRAGGRAGPSFRIVVLVDVDRLRVAGEVCAKLPSMYAFICAIPAGKFSPESSRLILVIVSLVEINTLDSLFLEGDLIPCAGAVRFERTLLGSPKERARSGRESSLSYLSGPYISLDNTSILVLLVLTIVPAGGTLQLPFFP